MTTSFLSLLNQQTEKLIDYTCCKKEKHRILKYGTGSNVKIPCLFPWKYVGVHGSCDNCGINQKAKMLWCLIIANSNQKCKCIE